MLTRVRVGNRSSSGDENEPPIRQTWSSSSGEWLPPSPSGKGSSSPSVENGRKKKVFKSKTSKKVFTLPSSSSSESSDEDDSKFQKGGRDFFENGYNSNTNEDSDSSVSTVLCSPTRVGTRINVDENGDNSPINAQDEDQEVFRPILVRATASTTKKRTFKCPNCTKEFFSSRKLSIHLEYIHKLLHPFPPSPTKAERKPKIFRCEKCGKTFTHRGHFVEHQRRENGVRPFPCDVEECGKRFRTQSNLTRHKMVVHSTKRDRRKFRKELSCKTCGKVAKTWKDFRRHLGSHGEGRFVCTLCGKVFSQDSYLQTHLPKHQGTNKDKPFKCKEEGCFASYLTDQGLKRHGVKVHSHCQDGDERGKKKKNASSSSSSKPHSWTNAEGIFKCGKCGRIFKTATALGSHERFRTCIKKSKKHLRWLKSQSQDKERKDKTENNNAIVKVNISSNSEEDSE